MLYEEISNKGIISDIDFRRYVLLVSQNYFDEEGNYTPYAAREALRYGFYKYCLDGIPTDTPYDELMNDSRLASIYSSGCNSGIVQEVRRMAKDMAEYEKQTRLYSLFSPIAVSLNELCDAEIERKTQEIKLSKIAADMNLAQKRLNNAQAEALEYQNMINEKISPDEQVEIIKKMNAEDFDIKKWTDDLLGQVTEKFYNSKLHSDNVEQVLNAKNEKIKELKTYKNMYDARNVKSDN